jgi:hypothetical protein
MNGAASLTSAQQDSQFSELQSSINILYLAGINYKNGNPIQLHQIVKVNP